VEEVCRKSIEASGFSFRGVLKSQVNLLNGDGSSQAMILLMGNEMWNVLGDLVGVCKSVLMGLN
jgi:hypothetical protein